MEDLDLYIRNLKSAFCSELGNHRSDSLSIQDALNYFDLAHEKISNPEFDNSKISLNVASLVDQPFAVPLSSDLENQNFEITLNDINSIKVNINSQEISVQRVIDRLETLMRDECPEQPCQRPKKIVLTPENLEELLRLFG